MKKYYDNGELITKERMEDEDWYGEEYQPFLEIVSFYPEEDISKTIQHVRDSWKEFFEEDFPNEERLIRWSVLHAERKSFLPDDMKENLKKMNKI